LKGKNKHVLIRKFDPTSNEKKKEYHHPIFVHYIKKFYLFIFSLPYEKEKIITILGSARSKTQL
jgi:hypothetical protein